MVHAPVLNAQQQWTLVRELRIGSLDRGNYSLGDIRDLVVDNQGSIYVFDRLNKAIFVYDHAGNFVRRVGRDGEGPGEFRMPATMGWLGDTLWVADPRLARITLFTRAGEVRGTLRILYDPRSPHHAASLPQALLADGWGVVEPTGIPPTGMDIARLRTPVVKVDRKGRAVDTLLVKPFASGFVILKSGGVLAFPYFNDHPLWDAEPSGSAILIAYRDAAPKSGAWSFRLRRIRADGTVQGDRRYSYPPIPVKANVVDSLMTVTARDIPGSSTPLGWTIYIAILF